ncbi:hypothetical protein KD050_12165 [Psychrobacillus sp. INOP01]|uniref:hypothetical protein n=1 Tax=Psychrobacillus sp. INOP01 TaxID=2829187 RepID=UPI001BA5E155|nr:hypothetical protein [Psychrobacillus sp. INOP01]QUG40071.1 hypothetical protein KD050_12165 [Psychrobacillus sp. INOP01]
MKKTIVLASILIGVILLSASFWYYTSGPTSFPTNEQLVEEMTDHFSVVSNSEIQDTVFLDDHHVFVPFIAEGEMYGFSLWEWNNRKWDEVLVSTNGDIRVWKIDSKDPTTYHIVWNYPPQDQLDYMKFYFINKRGYQVSDGEEHYEPGMQLEQTITLSENLYGSMKLSTEWVSVINSLIDSRMVSTYYFGWRAFDRSDKIMYPEGTENGSSSWGGDTHIEFTHFIEETELE